MPTKLVNGILDTIGDTPLVELKNLFPGLNARVFGKMESFNPGGSIKDRTAISMLLCKIRNFELDPVSSVVVESSSGNLAIGLAQVCGYFGMRFICVVDAKTSRQHVAMLTAYGATVEIVTEPDPQTNEYLPARLRRVRELVGSTPHAYWPNQYANPLNPQAHEETMREIADALGGRVDYLFSATSTTGTLRGCSAYIKRNGLSTTTVAVDAMGSTLFRTPAEGVRLLPGHGASIRPELFTASAASRVVHVTDLDCVVGCRRLIAREAILAGGSSGGTVTALEKLRAEIPGGSVCVLIFPDGGDRYLETVYSDAWVRSHFGEVFHLWKQADGAADPSQGR